MKSKNRIFSFIAALLFFSILTACTKDKNEPSKDGVMTVLDSRITQHLLAFKATLYAKSTSSMETDSAIWHLEGLLNLDNANNDHKFINSITIKDSAIVILVDGTISGDQITLIYNAFQNKIDSAIGLNPLMSADVVDVYTSQAILKDGSQILSMEASIGEDVTETTYEPFGINDNWYWTDGQGRCSGGGTPFDARIVLQNRFNNPVGGIPEGYFTNVEINTAYPFESQFYDQNNPNGTNKMIFSGGSWNPYTCIPYGELNYYLSTIDFIITDKQPVDKSIAGIIIVPDLIPGGGSGAGFYYYRLYYGIFHEGNPD